MALKIASYDEKEPSNQAIALESEHLMLSEELSHPNIISAYKQRNKFANFLIMEMELGLETLKSFQSRTQLSEV